MAGKMKLAVIVTDANKMVHIGGDTERTVRLFDLPQDAAAYIAAHRNDPYQTLALAIEIEAADHD